MDKSNAILPIVGDFPPEYRSIGEVSAYFSPYEWEAARAKYAAYELLVDACRKTVVSFETRNMVKGVRRLEDLDQMILKRWKEAIEKADAAAIEALRKALIAVEEIG